MESVWCLREVTVWLLHKVVFGYTIVEPSEHPRWGPPSTQGGALRWVDHCVVGALPLPLRLTFVGKATVTSGCLRGTAAFCASALHTCLCESPSLRVGAFLAALQRGPFGGMLAYVRHFPTLCSHGVLWPALGGRGCRRWLVVPRVSPFWRLWVWRGKPQAADAVPRTYASTWWMVRTTLYDRAILCGVATVPQNGGPRRLPVGGRRQCQGVVGWPTNQPPRRRVAAAALREHGEASACARLCPRACLCVAAIVAAGFRYSTDGSVCALGALCRVSSSLCAWSCAFSGLAAVCAVGGEANWRVCCT